MTITAPPTPTRELDTALGTLAAQKGTWIKLPLTRKMRYLEALRRHAAAQAAEWVRLSLAGKGLASDDPLAGEEWSSGPWTFINGCNRLITTLQTLADGADPLAGTPITTRHNGQLAVHVAPCDWFEKLMLAGMSAEVWQQPGVTKAALRAELAAVYRDPAAAGGVALILGAGNISSIPPLDLLYKLFVEGQVALVKLNPVNAYLRPVYEAVFAPLIAKGYVAFADGGAEVGRYLTRHPAVDAIHVTGSRRTHDAIVYGGGAEGETRRARDERLIDIPVTSELGGIGPTIVVPGPWTEADLNYQAENIVTQRLHNNGYNCSASQVLVLPYEWRYSASLLSRVRELLDRLPLRAPFYPGSAERTRAVLAVHPRAERLGRGAPDRQRVLITDLDADDPAEICFTDEFFAPVYAQVSLPGRDAHTFLRRAVAFANEKLDGTLTATILIHPQTQRELGEAFEQCLTDLRYGTIGINVWGGVLFNYAQATWGAFPGHAPDAVGSGIGVVHNALMFHRPERSVLRAPFMPAPRAWRHGAFHMATKPVWFVTHKRAHAVTKRVTALAADYNPLRLPGIFINALLG